MRRRWPFRSIDPRPAWVFRRFLKPELPPGRGRAVTLFHGEVALGGIHGKLAKKAQFFSFLGFPGRFAHLVKCCALRTASSSALRS
jgi:hypothetical protein